jgi:hypothetical protein
LRDVDVVFVAMVQLQEAFERVSEEAAQYRLTLQTSSQKESKATSMVNELTAVSAQLTIPLDFSIYYPWY